MARKALPTYSICSLTATPQVPSDFMADHFDHYLEVHKDLHFPHKHDFYHFVYFTEGSGKYSIDFVHFDLQPGQIYFMIPGQVHTWNFDKAPNGFIVNFSAQYIQALTAHPRYLDQFRFFSGIAAEQVVVIPKERQAALLHVLQTILTESAHHHLLRDDMIRTALLQLFILVNRNTIQESAAQRNNNSVLLRNFQKLIDQHYKEKKLTKEYAALLYVTPNYLNALSKDLAGQSAGELIRDRVLLEAKRLLVNADMTVSEIASELNFIDNSYFSKFFKKYVGVTPEIFRKQMIKQQDHGK